MLVKVEARLPADSVKGAIGTMTVERELVLTVAALPAKAQQLCRYRGHRAGRHVSPGSGRLACSGRCNIAGVSNHYKLRCCLPHPICAEGELCRHRYQALILRVDAVRFLLRDTGRTFPEKLLASILVRFHPAVIPCT